MSTANKIVKQTRIAKRLLFNMQTGAGLAQLIHDELYYRTEGIGRWDDSKLFDNFSSERDAHSLLIDDETIQAGLFGSQDSLMSVLRVPKGPIPPALEEWLDNGVLRNASLVLSFDEKQQITDAPWDRGVYMPNNYFAIESMFSMVSPKAAFLDIFFPTAPYWLGFFKMLYPKATYMGLGAASSHLERDTLTMLSAGYLSTIADTMNKHPRFESVKLDVEMVYLHAIKYLKSFFESLGVESQGEVVRIAPGEFMLLFSADLDDPIGISHYREDAVLPYLGLNDPEQRKRYTELFGTQLAVVILGEVLRNGFSRGIDPDGWFTNPKQEVEWADIKPDDPYQYVWPEMPD